MKSVFMFRRIRVNIVIMIFFFWKFFGGFVFWLVVLVCFCVDEIFGWVEEMLFGEFEVDIDIINVKFIIKKMIKFFILLNYGYFF